MLATRPNPDRPKAAVQAQTDDQPPIIVATLTTPWGTLTIELTMVWAAVTQPNPPAPPA